MIAAVVGKIKMPTALIVNAAYSSREETELGAADIDKNSVPVLHPIPRVSRGKEIIEQESTIPGKHEAVGVRARVEHLRLGWAKRTWHPVVPHVARRKTGTICNARMSSI